ncbi:DUF2934 domain-containing protein [Sinorhizobium numidicum]|uniref:DUF2934 domain-containing protein n=1 Tax=Sinorhizobium numidicum TaxID=680248 RepID=A0ABY8CSN9_9HYPH|nr:DUF2934 domain-containing protein [Sinorhizobium numidicum]WEX75665.1 DUF2934 domain-containing protein [Sinorhizobium numidicum]WEX81660.1 DUF2934 domain-containing protein [Sinorhizobium numidicum]
MRRRAYAIWEQEGRPEGQHARHWEQASREMQGENNSASDNSASDRGENIESEGATHATSIPVTPASERKP